MNTSHLANLMYVLQGKRIWVAGHTGMVGSALVRRLGKEDCEILTVARAELDLRNQRAVDAFVRAERPDAIVLAAAKVGGILANSAAADFLFDNIAIATNVIGAADRFGVGRLLFLGSSCIYPRYAPQPIEEQSLLSGPLETTNEWYAVAKIAGLKLAQAMRRQRGRDYVSAMPASLYGPGDNFDLNSGHVVPALIRKAHEAKLRGDRQMVMWGTGTPRREFLQVDDCADALVFVLKSYSAEEHINVGAGTDLSIHELTELICRIVGFEGAIVRDLSKPDGTPRKLMSSAKLTNLGWSPAVELETGIADTYSWFLENVAAGAGAR